MRWDFRRYLNLSIDRIGRDFTYGEAVDLILELMRETGSHLYAESSGYDRYAMSVGDLAALVHAEAYLNVNRDREKRKQPFDLGRPWGPKDPNADLTPEERAALIDQLRARSVFRDRE